MAVYVDDMRANIGRLIMCHMIADTDEELRLMAREIGVSEHGQQGGPIEIGLSTRAAAIDLGAIEITWRQCIAMNYRRKVIGQLGMPLDAEAWVRAEFDRRHGINERQTSAAEKLS